MVSRCPAPIQGFRATQHGKGVQAELSWQPCEGKAPSTDDPDSTALFGLQYELQSDHGAPGVWQTIYTGATPSCISTPLAPVAKIQFRVRGVSPITQPGPWATLELRRRQELFQPATESTGIAATGQFNRPASRWLWLEQEVTPQK